MSQENNKPTSKTIIIVAPWITERVNQDGNRFTKQEMEDNRPAIVKARRMRRESITGMDTNKQDALFAVMRESGYTVMHDYREKHLKNETRMVIELSKPKGGGGAGKMDALKAELDAERRKTASLQERLARLESGLDADLEEAAPSSVPVPMSSPAARLSAELAAAV